MHVTLVPDDVFKEETALLRMNTALMIQLLIGACALQYRYSHAAEKVDNNETTSTSINEEHSTHYERGGLRWCNLGVSVTSCPLTTAAMLDKYSNAASTIDSIYDDITKNNDHCLEDSSWLLHPTSGYVPRGSLCGIIGPSGAGKTTFLNSLGGATVNGGLHVTGTIYYDDGEQQQSQRLSQQNGDIAYLSQHDNFFAMLTPRETLEFAAKLQNQNKKIDDNKELVEKKLSSLGLLHVADRRIGDRTKLDGGGGGGGGFGLKKATKRAGGGAASGLSGGERRRLSVALELMTEPKIFLADEPTTGLDSSQAGKVVNLISKLAKDRNIPSICTLHQPKSSIWKMLDEFILLAPGGKMCYAGNRNDATAYFKEIGYECPHDTNPAEWFIDLVTIDTDDLEQGTKDIDRINFLHHRFLKSCTSLHAGDEQACLDKQQLATNSKDAGTDNRKMFSISRTLQRFGALFQRSLRQNIRNTRVLMLRLGAAVLQAKLFASIFKSVRHDKSLTKSIADRVALLTYGCINLSIMALMKTLDLFAKERGVVLREQMRSSYSSLEYLLAKVFAEMPLDASFALIFASVLKKLTGLRSSMGTLMKTYCLMTISSVSLGFAIGSIASTAETAMALGVPVLVILMVVGVINPSGVNTDEAPNLVMEWIKLFSPIKWAIEALVTAEFRGMTFEKDRDFWGNLKELPRMGGLAMVRDGDEVLDALGLGNANYNKIMSNLAKLTGSFLMFSWMGLAFGGPKFQQT
ncbi:ABC transporter, ABC-G family [Skeletonema marinoi]|uniref:ABC transporter, ABC-G family n=1 Tax=Skeletonema marinoi TaxID=267567 RepID=A0AAD9DBA7_9STRA|nr:ABC transporter, ABC-G family [Skeletonema marinoi]